ncbi:hypothetical protein [Streptomyces sp. Tu 6176]|nr:hypothetical protein [Streptomyces sp. Tu 6176]
MAVASLPGTTKHSVRDTKIRYADDPEICLAGAWTAPQAGSV